MKRGDGETDGLVGVLVRCVLGAGENLGCGYTLCAFSFSFEVGLFCLYLSGRLLFPLST